MRPIIKYLVLFLCLLYTEVNAQDANPDQLLKTYNNARLHDTVRLRALDQAADIFIYQNPDTCLIIGKLMLDMAINKGNNDFRFSALDLIGYTYQIRGESFKSLQYFDEALLIAKKLGNKKYMASALNHEGACQMMIENYPKARECYKAVLMLYEETDNKKMTGRTQVNYANVLLSDGDTMACIEQLQKAIDISREINDPFITSMAYHNLGTIHYAQREYEQAIECYTKALKTSEEIGNKQGTATICRDLGMCYTAKNDFTNANANFEKSKITSEQIGDKMGSCEVLLEIGKMKYKQKKYKDSKESAYKSLVISEEIGSVEMMRDAFGLLADVNEKLGDKKAETEMRKKYKVLNDTLVNEEIRKKEIMEKMQAEYAKKVAREKELREEYEKKQAEAKKQEAEKSNTNGKEIIVIGQAQNSKAGAILLTQEGDVYYVEGKTEWEEKYFKHIMRATGIVSVKVTKKEDMVNDKGEHSQGNEGETKYIKASKIELME